MSNERREIDYIGDAARLLLDVDGWLQDFAFRKSGGRLYYAVDTDVISLFLDPRKLAGYADVFQRGDEDSVLLAWLLSDFIFMDPGPLEGSRPFLLIPPHDEELQRIANALQRDLTSLSENVYQGIDDLVEEFRKLIAEDKDSAGSLSSIEGLATWLGKEAPKLIEAFQQRREGPEMQLKRLADLARAHAFQPMDAFVDPESECPLPAPDIEGNLKDAVEFLDTKSGWRDRLRHHKGPKKPGYAVDRDAEALARLDWTNQRLEGKARLVLITGSHYLFSAAAEQLDLEYALKYLRHPRSFLGSKDAFAIARDDPETIKANFAVFDWLNLFFPNAVKEVPCAMERCAQIQRQELEQLIKTGPRELTKHWRKTLDRLWRFTDYSSLEEYVLEWGGYIRSVAVARRIHPTLFPEKEGGTNAVARLLLEKIEHRRDHHEGDDLYDAVYCESVQTLNHLYSAPAWIGLWEAKKSRLEHIRGVPELRFDQDEAAQRYSDALLDDLSGKKRKFDLFEVYSDLERLDESNYLAHVIHALAYAAKGHWYAASALCRTAVAIRDCTPKEERAHRLGREASYLAAVAARRSALREKDLDDAEGWLDQARKRWDSNRQYDCRFESEHLAIDAMRCQFLYYNDEPILDETEVRETCRELLILIRAVQGQENEDRVRRWVLRQCLINFFLLNVVLLDARADSEFDPTEDKGRLLALFDEVTKGRRSDSFSRFVFKLSCVLWGDSRRDFLQHAKDIHSQHPPPSMPFDDTRFQVMLRLSEAARTSRQG